MLAHRLGRSALCGRVLFSTTAQKSQDRVILTVGNAFGSEGLTYETYPGVRLIGITYPSNAIASLEAIEHKISGLEGNSAVGVVVLNIEGMHMSTQTNQSSPDFEATMNSMDKLSRALKASEKTTVVMYSGSLVNAGYSIFASANVSCTPSIWYFFFCDASFLTTIC